MKELSKDIKGDKYQTKLTRELNGTTIHDIDQE